MGLNNTRDRVLDAASALIAERGIGNVAVRDITSRARVNGAAVNYHFGSKDQLIVAIIERGSEQFGACRTAMLEQAEQRGITVRAVVEALVLSAVTLARDGASGGRLFLQCRNSLRSDPQTAALLDAAFKPHTERFLDALEAVTPTVDPLTRIVRFAFAEALVNEVMANDRLPEWLARRAGAQPPRDQLAAMLIDVLVAAFDAPG